MKTYVKILQLLIISFLSLNSLSQVIVYGVSPASIAGYNICTWAQPTYGWGTANLNQIGNSVQDTIILANDGTGGTNAYGLPISSEACNPLINNVTGKIVLISRASCEISQKAINAQNAGAVGVIIITYPNSAPIPMGSGTFGANVTIPVVMISYTDGLNLINSAANTPTVVYIGNGAGFCPPTITNSLNVTGCDQYITPSGQVINQSTVINDTIQNIYGCDSVISTLNISINNSSSTPNFSNEVICNGSQYNFNGTILSQAGIYLDTISTVFGCDSIIGLNLSVNQPLTSIVTQTICSGMTYNWNGGFYNQSGQYPYVIQSSQGCDSTITLNLTVTPPINNTITTSICPGSSYILNGQSYSNAGTYYQYFQNSSGCDSVITLNIILLNNNFNTSFTSNQQLFTSPPFAVQFSNTTPNLSNYTFTWFWGDGTSTTSNNTTVFHEYLNNGLYTVTLEAVNNSTGCIDETTLTDYIFTTGGASCTHAATINQTGPINGCSGQPIILSCNFDPSFTYQWRRNGIYIQGNNNDTLLVNQSGSYTVIISVNGCPVSSAPITVNISSISPPTITASGTIQPCLGGSVTLTASSGFTNYLWSNGSTSPSITVTSSGNYSVQGTGSNGCIASSVPYTVNASFLPTQNICVVGVDSLTNNIRVVWEEPITTAIDSFLIYKESNVSNVYTQVGSRAYDSLSVWIDPVSNPAVQAYRYKITALDTCGVETPLSDFHKTIHLTINQGVGGAWNLIWSHYEGISFGSYNIYRGTSSSNITLLTTIQSNLNSYSDLTPPTGNVYYQVEIVNPNTCTPTKSTNYSSSKSNIVTNTQGSLIELSEEVMRIYPNPTNSKLTIVICNGLIGKEYSITDFAGRELRRSIFNSIQEKIELNSLSNGVYFIQVRGTNIQQRIIKQ
jgi:hypothetical protein